MSSPGLEECPQCGQVELLAPSGVCLLCASKRWRASAEPPPAELCWVGSYLASLEHEGRTSDELAAIDRVSRWLCTRGLAQ